MRIHFVTFATPAFRVRQWLLNRSALWFGRVDQLHVWTQTKLKQDGFTARHPELFPNSVGFGWYAWKPYIILRALHEASESDLVVYQDVGRRDPVLISKPLRFWDKFLTERGLDCITGVRIPHWGANRLWTKRSVFQYLGICDDRYKNEPQIQASWSVWKKCPRTERFVAEWAELCRQLDLVGGHLEHGLDGEVPGFQEHRWDQSLLTLLALRDGMPTLEPSDRMEPQLNEKCIDSFILNQNVGFGFQTFKLLLGAYHKLELMLKKIGCGRNHLSSSANP